jgi:predicted CXXCH cytochrome family protein
MTVVRRRPILPLLAAFLIGACATTVLAQSGHTTRPLGPAAPATRPAQAFAWRDCVTSECHANIKAAKVVHGPVASDRCDACHELTDARAHEFKLLRGKQQLCTYCHELRDAKVLPVVHRPVARGECLGCHDPHGGATPELMREATIEATCSRCHDSVTDGRHFLHTPVKQGACSSCHAPHASRFPKLLDVVGTDLCLTCHVQFAASLNHAKVTHKALEQGCEKCHEAHGSNHPMSTTQPVVAQCGGCHEKTMAIVTNARGRHSPAVEGLACMNCHTPHGGAFARLLKDREDRTCLSCHGQPLTNARGGVLAAMTQLQDPAFHKHGAMRDGECSGCHAPHGGEQSKLLTRPFSRAFYQRFTPRSYALCLGCHDPKLATQRRAGQSITAFRDGDRNLHFVHVNNGWRSHGCNACHASHGTTGNDRDVRGQVVFGAWQISIKFNRTDTGGRCTTGCHLPYAYDRDQPVKPTTWPATEPTTEATTEPAPSQPVLTIARGPRDGPATISFSATTIDGRTLTVPDPSRATLIVLVRDDQALADTWMRDLARAIEVRAVKARVAVVISGANGSLISRDSLRQQFDLIVDPGGDLAAALAVRAWPTAVVVAPDGSCLTRTNGTLAVIARGLSTYLNSTSSRTFPATAPTPTTTQPTVGDGPERQRARRLREVRDLLHSGNAQQACTILLDAARSGELPMDAKVDLVTALLRLQRFDDARRAFAEIPASAMRPGERAVIEAGLLINGGRWNEARATLLDGLGKDPKCSAAHLLLGQVYEHELDWPSAAKEYRISAESDRGESR